MHLYLLLKEKNWANYLNSNNPRTSSGVSFGLTWRYELPESGEKRKSIVNRMTLLLLNSE